MLDLSNNNGPVDFNRVYDGGTRRVYLKLTEGSSFVDPKASGFYMRAHRADLKVGFYHFGRPSKNDATEEAKHFLRSLPPSWRSAGHALRPCLDLEDPHIKPGKAVARWAHEWILYVKNHIGLYPILYGSSYYINQCDFDRPWVNLWLAAYGRNDGREHPYVPPHPWTVKKIAAHQYSSQAHVAGVAGQVDISHVYKPRQLDVYRWSR